MIEFIIKATVVSRQYSKEKERNNITLKSLDLHLE